MTSAPRANSRHAPASVRPGDPALATRLRGEISGEVLFDPYSRGRYSTDASIYQIEPIGVVVPRTVADIQAAIQIAREAGVAVLPRGAGTSQCGQTVGEALVVDVSRHLNRVTSFDGEQRRVRVQPGIVLDELNAKLKPEGLFFPVDVSPANRATIGGMTGNNSCGARSIRYGNMVHNVRAIEAILADGTTAEFAMTPGNLGELAGGTRYLDLVQSMRGLANRERDEIARRFPKLLRRVGGYNIDSISAEGHNMARLLVGSEGTLGFFTEVELDLQPIPTHRVLGICHFPTFYQAMETTPHIVALEPSAVELVDRTLMELARDIDMFRATLERFVRGAPDSLLLVEFAGEDEAGVRERLRRLGELMADHGFPHAVVEACDAGSQREVWEVRKAGLNIMMSMKGEGKPVSFVEDCAVGLEDLAEYTRRLDEIFAKHNTTGTWYAHASVGTLHVRPILNMKEPASAKTMRAIAQECFAMVREYKGSHSGEHGDGLVRSEFHEMMFGSRIVRAFEDVKDNFDPEGLFNPGKVVRAPAMDDRELMRYKPGYAPLPLAATLDWSPWGGFSQAVEMCNNNGACRKADPGVMCPSYRVTKDERHVTRGRANTLRLALTGQLGPHALTSPGLRETMSLCVGCKACKRECPTGVDMARMKIEFLYHHRKLGANKLSLRERLIAYLPRYAGLASRLAPLSNLRNHLPGLARISEAWLGLKAERRLPRFRRDAFSDRELGAIPLDATAPGAIPPGANPPGANPKEPSAKQVVLWVDTFNRWFEPENAKAALQVLEAAGYEVIRPQAHGSARPLCCGRTFLAAGLVDEAKIELHRTLKALGPHVEQGRPIVGLEPSCLLTLRDELSAIIPGVASDGLGDAAVLLEEFLAAAHKRGALNLPLKPIPAKTALLHGHCHQKAFGLMGAVECALGLIPELEVQPIASSCCGMAGSFGYEAEHYAVSMQMGELSLLPAVRRASPDTLVVADGISCRHQIAHGTGREAIHVARALAAALG